MKRTDENRPKRGRRVAAWIVVAGLLGAGAGLIAEALVEPTADWRFGKVKVTDFGEGEVNFYMSLRNKGKPSREPVLLYALPAGAD